MSQHRKLDPHISIKLINGLHNRIFQKYDLLMSIELPCLNYPVRLSRRRSHSLAARHTRGWQADTSHWHTETPPVDTGAQARGVHRTPHQIGRHSLGGHHNAEPGSNMVHCRVGVNFAFICFKKTDFALSCAAVTLWCVNINFSSRCNDVYGLLV